MFALRRNSRNINFLNRNQIRQIQTNDSLIDNCIEIRNRNPRNLELLRIARKPVGYRLDAKGNEYWHKLIITKHTRYVSAEIHHHENGIVISASTKEQGLKKNLYSLKDAAAYINLGRVLAQRCLECGIFSVTCDLDKANSEKLALFVNEIQKVGLQLEEPPRYVDSLPQHRLREEKPWEVFE